MKLFNLCNIILIGIIVNHVHCEFDGQVSDDTSTQTDYSAHPTDLVGNLGPNLDEIVSGDYDNKLNTSNSSSSKTVENTVTELGELEAESTDGLKSDSDQTNELNEEPTTWVALDEELVTDPFDSELITESNLSEDLTTNTEIGSSEVPYNEVGFNEAETTQTKSDSDETVAALNDIESTDESRKNNEFDEITFTADMDDEISTGNDDSTVQTFIIDDRDSSSKMPGFDEDEGSGDSEQIINLGGEETTTDDQLLVCSVDEFSCDNRCLDMSMKCDSVFDCEDKSDEQDCQKETSPISFTTTSPTEALKIVIQPGVETENGLVINVDERSRLSIQCSVSGPLHNLKAIIYKDQTLIQESETETVVAHFDSVYGSDEGEYLCYGFPADRSTYAAAAVKLVVNRISGQSSGVNNPRVVEANLNDHVDISCDLSSYTNEPVKWRKLNGDKSAYSQENLGKLYLYYLKLEDSGEYECYTDDGRSANRVRLIVRDPSATERPSVSEYAIRTYLEKSNIDFKSGESHHQVCTGMTNGNDLRIEWYDQRGQLIRSSGEVNVETEVSKANPLTKKSMLVFTRLRPEMAGRYECRVTVSNQVDSISFDLISMDSIGGVTPSPEQSKVCDIIEATCRNGECIQKSVLCNGVMDCSDGSDEQNCGGGSSDGRCEPNEMQCRNGKCVQKIWYCDGEDDCGDNTDELNCPKSNPEDKCKSHEYLCASGDQCVLKGFVCDNENDCNDLSDEIGCEQPRIIRGPTRNLTVVIGGTIEISCEAAGFPEPFINWRLNWGHVCEPPRCFSKTENGRGTLTITDAVREDAGAYSCEALNSKGRLFAIPDAILAVYGGPRPCNCFNHADTCDSDGNCMNCRHNTVGRNCESCMNGYTGNPRMGNPDDCQPIVAPPATQCGQRYYNKAGRCVPCFCNGLPVDCQASSLVYKKINSFFQDNAEDWTMIDDSNNEMPVSFDRQSMAIHFSNFPEGHNYYFNAPSKYKGNKLASYGGNLSFTIRYEGSNTGERPNHLDVRISGAGLELIHTDRSWLYAYQDQEFIVPLFEDEFRRSGDYGAVNRESFLMALSNIDEIKIRASYIQNEQYTVTLSSVTLDYGQDVYASAFLDRMARVKATPVEICQCPEGYSGFSCESCAPGYQKSSGGFYLGQCVKQDQNVLVIDVPNNNLILKPGETHVIHVTINEGGRVVWQKENEPQGYLPNGVRQEGNDLVIFNARPEISGNYACTVFTPSGEVKEVVVITVEPSMHSPPYIQSPNKQITNVRPGGRFRLECIARGIPVPSIRIETPTYDSAFPEPSAIRQRTPTAFIEIDYFTSSNAGEYRCIAENEHGERAVETYLVNLDTGSFVPPTIKVEPKDLEVVEGSNVLINTSYTGTEPVKATVKLYGPKEISNLIVNQYDKSIDIKSVTKDNEGQYIITVTNQFGTANDYFHIKVIEAPGPKIFAIQSTVRVYEGSSLRLEPRVQYVGKPYFTWTGPVENSPQLIENVQQSDQNLFIPNVSMRNAGVYTLTLLDSTGSTSVRVRVIVDPSQQKVTRKPNSLTPFNVYESQVIELEQDETAMLVCALRPEVERADALVFHSWSKSLGRFQRNIRPNIERLQILKFKPSNVGDYKCTVATSEGFKREVVVTLKLKEDRPEPATTQRPYIPPLYTTPYMPPVELTARLSENRKDLTAGENFEITCDVTGNPKPQVQWLFNQNPINDGDYQLYPRGETLYGRQVNKNINGYIICRAIDQSGQTAEDSVLINVVEIATRPPTQPKPSVSARVEPASATAQIGESTVLNCLTENTGANHIIEWVRQDEQSLPRDSMIRANTLSLSNLQRHDSGVYVCRVIDRATGVEHKAYSTLIVIDNPVEPEVITPLELEVLPEIADLVQGQDAEFMCNVLNGDANVILVWKKVSGALDPSRHIVSENGRRLKIVNVQQDDRGYFECQADNAQDSIRDFVRVDVEAREAPVVEIYPQQDEILIDRGAVAYAQCRIVAGIPSPSIEWTRVDKQPLSSNIVISQEGSLLQIQNANDGDFGDYECVSSNVAGRASGRIRISARDFEPQVDPNEEERRREFERQRAEEEARRRQEEAQNRGDEAYRRQQEEERRRMEEERRRQEEERRRMEEERRRQEEERRRQDEERRRQEEERRREEEQNKPTFDQKPDAITDDRIEVQEGQSVTLNCHTSSQSEHRFYWIDPNNQYMTNVNADGSVDIPNVRRQDAGTYICTVVNSAGNARSMTELKVNYFEQQPLKVTLTPKSRSVLQGTTIDFNCNVENSPNPSQVQWSKQSGEPLPEGHVINRNVLRLFNVQPKDGGRYQCGASNDGAYAYDDAYLEIVDPNTNVFPVFIQVKTEGIESNPNAAIVNMYRFGVRMAVDCVPQTTGDSPIVSIEWSKQEGGADRHKQHKQGDKNTLILEALSSMDLGTYVCIAQKQNGEVAQNEILFENHADHGAFFHYKIKGPSETVVYEEEKINMDETTKKMTTNKPAVSFEKPTAKILEEDRIIRKVGETLQLTCEVTGIPVPHLKWTNGKGDVLSEQRVIVIPNLKEENTDYYVCAVENSAGQGRAYVHLDVQPNNEVSVESTTLVPAKGKKPFVYVKSLDWDDNILGRELTIVCKVTDPEAQVDFSRSDKDMSHAVHVTTHPEDETMKLLTFRPFNEQDAGEYICFARNQFGEHQDKAIIKKEFDGSFSFKADNAQKSGIEINMIGTLFEGNYIELSAELTKPYNSKRMRRQLAPTVDYYTWTKFPALPRSAISEVNKLLIQQYNDDVDNGLYFVRATSGDVDYYGNKLIASNDFLLRENDYFSIEKEDDKTILIRCRPFLASSIYTWSAKDSDVQENELYRIEGDDLFIYNSDVTSKFTCKLSVDGELGPISLDLEVDQDLIKRAFKKPIYNIDTFPFDYEYGEDYVAADCIPGKTCEADYYDRVRNI